jgi:hypothetical protein
VCVCVCVCVCGGGGVVFSLISRLESDIGTEALVTEKSSMWIDLFNESTVLTTCIAIKQKHAPHPSSYKAIE